MDSKNSANSDELITPGLYASLALRQQALNVAVGIRRVTPQVSLLCQLYELQSRKRRQKALSQIMDKSFYLGVIRGARQRIKEIKTAITPDTPLEEARRLYGEVMTLQEEIDQAVRVING